MGLYQGSTPISTVGEVTHTHSNNEIIFTDTSTGETYRLRITDGKLVIVPYVDTNA